MTDYKGLIEMLNKEPATYWEQRAADVIEYLVRQRDAAVNMLNGGRSMIFNIFKIINEALASGELSRVTAAKLLVAIGQLTDEAYMVILNRVCYYKDGEWHDAISREVLRGA